MVNENNELKKELEKHLIDLTGSSFRNESLLIKLLNLINGIRQVTDDIYERTELISDGVEAQRDPQQHLDAINRIAGIVNTLCDVIDENIVADDYATISNIIYILKKVNGDRPQ